MESKYLGIGLRGNVCPQKFYICLLNIFHPHKMIRQKYFEYLMSYAVHMARVTVQHG